MNQKWQTMLLMLASDDLAAKVSYSLLVPRPRLKPAVAVTTPGRSSCASGLARRG